MGKKKKKKKDPETGLLRIIALKDFSNVKKGDRGGLIGKESTKNCLHNVSDHRGSLRATWLQLIASR